MKGLFFYGNGIFKYQKASLIDIPEK